MLSLAHALRSDNSVQELGRYIRKHAVDGDGLIDAGDYLCRLGLAVGSRLHLMNIVLMVSTTNVPLQSERCWRLGLIVNELLTNAARHACSSRREGRIRIELTHEDSIVHCAVSDDVSEMTGERPVRGLSTANDLANSLSGRIGHWFDDKGDSFVVTFPFTDRERQANKSARRSLARSARFLSQGGDSRTIG